MTSVAGVTAMDREAPSEVRHYAETFDQTQERLFSGELKDYEDFFFFIALALFSMVFVETYLK